MDTFRIVPLTAEQVRRLYGERLTADFPPEELKPLSAIETALSGGRYACWGAADGDEILAYAFFVKNGAWALLDYYAVRRDLRCRGVGSRFLRRLSEEVLEGYDTVLLETDEPDAAPDEGEREIRERRLRFYLRNGLTETGVRAAAWGVLFRILALPVGETPTAGKTREVYAALYRSVMPEALFYEKIRI